MNGLGAILWQEHIVFKRRFISTTLSALISPLLYLIAFGWGIGSDVTLEGMSYLEFVIPGIIAMNTMMLSFNNTANSINISRLFYKTFEEYMVAPINMGVYTLGKVISGSVYGIYSSVLILVIVKIGGVSIKVTPWFIFIVLLNCLMFSSGGFIVGLMIKTHAGLSKFTSFIITPMSFLCGTFFSLKKMPKAIEIIINILPLTHTSNGLRNSAFFSWEIFMNIFVLCVYLALLFIIGVILCKSVE